MPRFRLLITLLTALWCMSAVSAELPKEYGYYAEAGGSYKRLSPYPHRTFNFSRFAEVNHAADATSDGTTVLLLHKKDFDQFELAAVVRKIAIVNHEFFTEVKPTIEPLATENYYRLTFSNLAAEDVLFVHDLDSVHAVAVKEPLTQLQKLFAEKQESPAAALANLEDALKAYPEDKTLLAARKKLEAESTITDQNRVFDYAVEQEQRADAVETLSAKVDMLERAKAYYAAYIDKYPEGVHVAKAQERIKALEKRLKI